MEIAKRLRTRREELGIKVKDIAQHVGVAESTYRDWENGRSIQGEPYQELAEILDISLGKLLGVDERDVIQSFLLEVTKLEKSVKKIKLNATKLF